MPTDGSLLQLTWTLAAWEDYEYWQGQDRKTLKRINALSKDCLCHPFEVNRQARTAVRKPLRLLVAGHR